MEGGPAEREFVQAARRLGFVVRAGIVLVVQAAALLVVPSQRLGIAAGAFAVVLGWQAFSLARLRDRPGGWVLWADVVLLAVLCLAQPLLESPFLARDDCGWVLLVTEAAVVAYQWLFPRRAAVAAATVLAAAYLAGALAMGALPLGTALLSSAWLLITAVVSGWLYDLMRTSTAQVDRATAAHEQATREIEVAGARRQSAEEHLATLHDTVAATLMMVGLGAAEPHSEGGWLRQQAGRDLAVLVAPVGGAGPGRRPIDLRAGLDDVIRASGLEVAFDPTGPEAALPPVVADSIYSAAGEALRNVARHALVGRAVIELDASDDRVRVRIRDDGPGFAADARPGRGIRHSIAGRMARAGGVGTVTSSPEGVVVELAWARS